MSVYIVYMFICLGIFKLLKVKNKIVDNVTFTGNNVTFTGQIVTSTGQKCDVYRMNVTFTG